MMEKNDVKFLLFIQPKVLFLQMFEFKGGVFKFCLKAFERCRLSSSFFSSASSSSLTCLSSNKISIRIPELLEDPEKLYCVCKRPYGEGEQMMGLT